MKQSLCGLWENRKLADISVQENMISCFSFSLFCGVRAHAAVGVFVAATELEQHFGKYIDVSLFMVISYIIISWSMT